MDLELDIINQLPKTSGTTRIVEAEIIDELTVETVTELHEVSEVKTVTIQKMRHRHHTLAKLLVSGMKRTRAAVVAGYSPATVKVLQEDKAFKELCKMYKAELDDTYMSMHERLFALSVDLVDELQERLNDDPSAFTNRMILDTLTKVSDRSGHGPSSTTTTNINVDIASRLQTARERMKTINVTSKEIE